MTTRKLQPTNRIELDFSEAELTLEVLPSSEVELEWDDTESEIITTTENGTLLISPQSCEDDYQIVLKSPDTVSVVITCLVGAINFEYPWKGLISIDCTGEIELDCDEASSVAVKCETGSIDINSVSELAIETADADVTIGECTGNLAIEAISSDVEVDSGKSIEIKTVSGDIDIGTAEKILIQTLSGDVTIEETGDCDIENTSGDIDIGAVSGALKIKSISSEITIGDLKTENATIEDVSGTIEIDSLLITKGSVVIKTVSDDVHVGLHGDSTATFKLRSSSGEITTPDETESGVFSIGAGTAEVSITTVSGSIEIE